MSEQTEEELKDEVIGILTDPDEYDMDEDDTKRAVDDAWPHLDLSESAEDIAETIYSKTEYWAEDD